MQKNQKKDAKLLCSFPTNEHHDQIKRQMLSFLNINKQLLEATSQNFVFEYQLSLTNVTDQFTDYNNVCCKIDIKTRWEIISIVSAPFFSLLTFY